METTEQAYMPLNVNTRTIVGLQSSLKSLFWGSGGIFWVCDLFMEHLAVLFLKYLGFFPFFPVMRRIGVVCVSLNLPDGLQSKCFQHKLKKMLVTLYVSKSNLNRKQHKSLIWTNPELNGTEQFFVKRSIKVKVKIKMLVCDHTYTKQRSLGDTLIGVLASDFIVC